MIKYSTVFLLLISFASCGQSTVHSLKPEAFKYEMQKNPGTLIDVRTSEEYAEGHLPNAINIDFYDDDFAQKVKKQAGSQPVYLYCKVGGRSSKALQMLEKDSLPGVHLKGGIEAWQEAGLEIIK